MLLEAIRFNNRQLEILYQLKLPFETVYLQIQNVKRNVVKKIICCCFPLFWNVFTDDFALLLLPSPFGVALGFGQWLLLSYSVSLFEVSSLMSNALAVLFWRKMFLFRCCWLGILTAGPIDVIRLGFVNAREFCVELFPSLFSFLFPFSWVISRPTEICELFDRPIGDLMLILTGDLLILWNCSWLLSKSCFSVTCDSCNNESVCPCPLLFFFFLFLIFTNLHYLH